MRATATASRSRCAVVLLAAAFLFPACKSLRKSEKPVTIRENRKLEDRTADELLRLINDSAFHAGWLSGRAEVETNIDNDTRTFDIAFRARRDSALWISISPLLGIEVARVLLTRDSVFFMDRLHRRYEAADYGFLNNLLRMNIDFDIVQGVFTGNIFAYKKNKFNSVYNDEDNYYILSTLSKHKLKRSLEEKDPNKPVIQDMWVSDLNYRIGKLSIEDDKVRKKMVTVYDDFRPTGAGLFPFFSNTTILAERVVLIRIRCQKLKIDEPQEFPFRIPDSYEKMR
jgi:hypothetical protein